MNTEQPTQVASSLLNPYIRDLHNQSAELLDVAADAEEKAFFNYFAFPSMFAGIMILYAWIVLATSERAILQVLPLTTLLFLNVVLMILVTGSFIAVHFGVTRMREDLRMPTICNHDKIFALEVNDLGKRVSTSDLLLFDQTTNTNIRKVEAICAASRKCGWLAICVLMNATAVAGTVVWANVV